ncbi:MAG: shikimate dehydrogenase [Aestuariivirga sp.]|nr:shikimate dehydrogenase [Aestuariivirga sp.]
MKKACVIGWPIAHSRSPLIHNYWLKRYGIDAVYEKKAVEPKNVALFIANLAASEFIGCNVTIPHKEAAFQAVSKADEIAGRLGAVNTVYIKDGVVCGTNTDGEGFIASLRHAYPAFELKNKTAVIVGAGGAAKAIIGALLDEGVAKIGIINRTRERIHELQTQFGSGIYEISETNSNDTLKSCALLVNTTSMGMEGQPPLELEIQSLGPYALVADIVYTPLETAFLKKAKRQGNPVLDGLGMLLHQAVRGFELWFGVKPEVTAELHALIAGDVQKANKQ